MAEDKVTRSKAFFVGMIPEAHSTIEQVVTDLDADPYYGGTDYGHAAGSFVHNAYEYYELTPEEQKAMLKKDADKLIKRYGPDIINFMKPELREALGLPPKKEEK